MLVCFCFFFFFSSRRRHTRWTGDWSSDVCSSDLTRIADAANASRTLIVAQPAEPQTLDYLAGTVKSENNVFNHITEGLVRSEERRVGKECRSRWSPDH